MTSDIDIRICSILFTHGSLAAVITCGMHWLISALSQQVITIDSQGVYVRIENKMQILLLRQNKTSFQLQQRVSFIVCTKWRSQSFQGMYFKKNQLFILMTENVIFSQCLKYGSITKSNAPLEFHSKRWPYYQYRYILTQRRRQI